MTTYWLNGREGFEFTDEVISETERTTTEPIFPRNSTIRQQRDRGSSWGWFLQKEINVIDFKLNSKLIFL